jgi:hypothetical protein
MVVVSDKVKDSVHHHAVEFILELRPVLDGVFTDAVDADEKVSGNLVALAIVKGDDIGVIVVLKELAIDGKDVLVVAEEIAHFAHFLAIRGSHAAYPRRGFALFDFRKGYVFVIIGNHS